MLREHDPEKRTRRGCFDARNRKALSFLSCVVKGEIHYEKGEAPRHPKSDGGDEMYSSRS
jgi:hypothetical protein